jgi:hypothetical protein
MDSDIPLKMTICHSLQQIGTDYPQARETQRHRALFRYGWH